LRERLRRETAVTVEPPTQQREGGAAAESAAAVHESVGGGRAGAPDASASAPPVQWAPSATAQYHRMASAHWAARASATRRPASPFLEVGPAEPPTPKTAHREPRTAPQTQPTQAAPPTPFTAFPAPAPPWVDYAHEYAASTEPIPDASALPVTPYGHPAEAEAVDHPALEEWLLQARLLHAHAAYGPSMAAQDSEWHAQQHVAGDALLLGGLPSYEHHELF
jgi:hypothetical protein